MTDQSTIADKIRKVLAKAEGTDNPQEAETFMAKAEALLYEHNMSMLDLNDLDTVDPVGTAHSVAKYRVNDSWMGNLGGALARYYGLRPIVGGDAKTKHTKHLTVVGRESNRVTFELMLPWIKSQVLAQGRQLYKENPVEYKSDRSAARKVANALTFRIQDIVAEQKKEETTVTSKGGKTRALVPVDLIDEVIKKEFPNLKEGRQTSVATTRSATSAAATINLSRKATGSTVKRIA
jgi:hypothetical protein